MKNLSVDVRTGRLVDQDADLLINSSNTYLLMGSGTAKQVRDAGGYLPKDDRGYWELVKRANPQLKKVLDYINSQRPIPSKVQKECLKYIIEVNDSNEVKLGDSVITSSGDLASIGGKAKHVAHAVGMTYDWKIQPFPPVIPADFYTVRDSLFKSLKLAAEKECRTVALPIMCTRKGRLSKEASSLATFKALEGFNRKKTSVENVSIVLYSDELKKDEKWFRDFFNV
jgi:O-acetyl-ADP-ribose deacetylase (regulator of RNase III)